MRHVVLLSLLAGVLAGVVGAIAIPRTREAARATQSVAPAVTPLGRLGAPRVAPPRRLARAQRRTVAVAGTVHVGARAADPDGGPAWAVRTFVRGRRTGADVRSFGDCVQLGRIVGGRFGWVDATNTFRRARYVHADAPTRCGEQSRRGGKRVIETTLFGARLDGTLAPRRIVYWGRVPRGAAAELSLRDKTLRPRVTHSGAWLAFASEDDTGSTALRVRSPRGRPFVEYLDPSTADPRHRERLRRARRQQQRMRARGYPRFALPLPGVPARPLRIEARTPDPHGGPGIGLAVAPRTGGGTCVSQPGAIVGGRVGTIDERLGTFDAFRESFLVCDSNQSDAIGPRLGRKWPTRFSSSYANPFSDPGDPMSRTPAGGLTLAGRAAPEVEAITIASPRDVRTFVPSRRHRLFVVAYGGTFVGGDLVITARFRGGGQKVQRIPAGIG